VPLSFVLVHGLLGGRGHASAARDAKDRGAERAEGGEHGSAAAGEP
jgi:hypothetical protein